MRIRLISVGTRLPRWVQDGYAEYAKRLGRGFVMELIEIAPARRARASPIARAVATEGDRLLAAVRERDIVVALTVDGTALSTGGVADRLQTWGAEAGQLALLVGGPDGLDERCRARADFCWSLSPLTLPHGLVRIVVAEQIYRAVSLLSGHPYHRG